MLDVTEKFIKPMLVHFVIPESGQRDADRYISDLVEDLAEFSEAVLTEAVIRLRRREGAGRFFPPVADCVSMCRRIHDEFALDKRPAGPSTSGRSKAEIDAEQAHLGRLNTLHASGDTERAARLLIILAVRSYQTKKWDFLSISHEVRTLAVKKYRCPGWLIGVGKRNDARD